MLVSAMKLEGLTDEQACERITLMDVEGLLETSRTDLLSEQKRFAKDAAPTKDRSADHDKAVGPFSSGAMPSNRVPSRARVASRFFATL